MVRRVLTIWKSGGLGIGEGSSQDTWKDMMGDRSQDTMGAPRQAVGAAEPLPAFSQRLEKRWNATLRKQRHDAAERDTR